MPKRTILIGDDAKGNESFLIDYFSETKSIPILAKSEDDFLDGFALKPDFVFLKIEWMKPEILSRLQAYRNEKKAAKFFSIGYANDETFKWDNQFEAPFEPRAFRKTLLGEISFPPKAKLLVIDDEEGVLEMFKDFFELQKDPAFEVHLAKNGLEGFEMAGKVNPDCIVLDLKMPVRSGAECYSDFQKSGRETPIIIFLDANTADEISRVRKFGNPVFVEKSGHRSSMQEMVGIVKKLIAFA